MIEMGVLECFGFDDVDIVLMCVLYSSEDCYIVCMCVMFEKVVVYEVDLCCGGYLLLFDVVYWLWIKCDYMLIGVCSNCFGKYVGMLVGV